MGTCTQISILCKEWGERWRFKGEGGRGEDCYNAHSRRKKLMNAVFAVNLRNGLGAPETLTRYLRHRGEQARAAGRAVRAPPPLPAAMAEEFAKCATVHTMTLCGVMTLCIVLLTHYYYYSYDKKFNYYLKT